MEIWWHLRLHDRQPFCRKELPAGEHEDDNRCRSDEDIGIDEPTEVADRQEDSPQPLVEVAAGKDVHAEDAFGGALGGNDIFVGIVHHGHGAEQDGAIIEETVRPAELEEGIAEQGSKAADLHFEDGMAAMKD